MSLKAKLPDEDPQTVALREAAELRAESGRIEETQENLSNETLQIIRQFGRIANQSSLGGLGNSGSGFGNFGGSLARTFSQNGINTNNNRALLNAVSQ